MAVLLHEQARAEFAVNCLVATLGLHKFPARFNLRRTLKCLSPYSQKDSSPVVEHGV